MTLLFNAGDRPGAARSGRRRRATTTATSPIRTFHRSCSRPTWIAEQRAALPELPEARRARLEIGVRPPGLRRARAHQRESRWPSTSSRWSRPGVEPKTAANWVMGDVMTSFNETGAFPVDAPAGRPRDAGAGRRREPPGREAGLRRAGAAPGRRAQGRRRTARPGAGERPGRAGRLGGRGAGRASRRGGALSRAARPS